MKFMFSFAYNSLRKPLTCYRTITKDCDLACVKLFYETNSLQISLPTNITVIG